jgi:O-6-methylguanine DNA methyltransferase
MSEIVTVGRVETPEGTFGAVFTARGLGRLTFPSEDLAACEGWARRWAPGAQQRDAGWQLDELAAQLADYFAGRLRAFEIPLDLRGTPFQLAAWQALTEIGYGQLRTYAEHAAAIGRPRAIRAVGAANGANPIPILVPCHRLVGKGGALVKYGGGLEVKRRLLVLEGALQADRAWERHPEGTRPSPKTPSELFG